MRSVTFYFDFLSPFSYFAYKRLQELKDECEVEIIFKPVPLLVLLRHWGIKGPGEVKPKREFLLKTCLRKAKLEGFTHFRPSPKHPFNSLYALRLAALIGEHQKKIIDTLWKLGWEEEGDLSDPDEITRALAKNGLPAEELMELIFQPETKAMLKNHADVALKLGVFGVPSFVVDDGEVFWGEDSLLHLKLYLKKNDPLPRDYFHQLLKPQSQTPSQGDEEKR